MKRVTRIPKDQSFKVRPKGRMLMVREGGKLESPEDWGHDDEGDPVRANDTPFTLDWEDRKHWYAFYVDGDDLVRHLFPDFETVDIFFQLRGDAQ